LISIAYRLAYERHFACRGEIPRSRSDRGSPKSPTAPPLIALPMEALLAWVAERVAKFPRDHKFTTGDRLIETCIDILTQMR
jgi:hypothetical protein